MWKLEKKYQCEVSNQGYDFLSDTSSDKGGSGEGIRPHELLEAALASCINIIIRMTLDKLKISVHHIRVTVHLDRTITGKTIFHYQYDIDTELNQKEKIILEDAIHHCPVKKTLLNKIEFQSMG